MKNRIMQITAIISAISCMTACAAQTTSTVSEVTASTTVQTTPTPQETKKPLAETAQTTTTAKPETKAPETAATTTAVQTTPKPQETKAPETVVTTTTTTVQTTPAPEWTETKTSGTKYVNTSCYSRKKAVIGAETVALHNVNEKVTVTAKTNTGYFKLSDGSFIHGDYLSDSKVVIQTTTTTAKEQETTPKPAEQTKPQNTFTVYALGGTGKGYDVYTNIYDDEDCTVFAKGLLVGMKLTVVETIKDKGVYKLDDGRYVKISDTTKTDPVEKMYYYPFDLDAIKKVIVDDAVNNYGLINDDDPNWVPEGSSWNVPLVIDADSSPNLVKSQVESFADADYSVAQMKKGDYFKVYIEKIPYEKADKFGYSYDPFTGKLFYSKEEFEQLDAYAIYFLRGQGQRAD